MKKNVVFWIGVRSDDEALRKKHSDFKYLDVSKQSWQYWCKRNDVIFYEYMNSSEQDTNAHRVTWTRWFDVFDQLESNNISYDKIAVIDGSTIVKWNAPNFFKDCQSGLTAFRSLENVKWIYEGVTGYKSMFNNFDFDLTKYIDCGFQVFDDTYKSFLARLKKFYYENYNSIMQLQNTIKRGTDQPVYNYLLQIDEIKVNMNLSPGFNLNHLTRFDWLSHNWQLKEDTMPFFIKYGYVWKFSGFDRTQRYSLMKQTWDLIGDKYE
jgi:hypothetical protein